MLILTRRVGESIRIGSEITLKVLRRRGATVRLGIIAPKSTEVAKTDGPIPASERGGR